MMKDIGAGAFGYGWPVPVLMVATYNDDGSVNVMNLHEAMRTNAGDLALCIGPRSKTNENVKKRGAFTVALVSQKQMAEIDYFGSVSGYRVPDKFIRTGLKAVKSEHVDAPIIEGCPVVIECTLIEMACGTNFTTVLAKIVSVVADEMVLDERGKVDSLKTDMILYDPFGSGYVTLGRRAGKAWSEGKKYI